MRGWGGGERLGVKGNAEATMRNQTFFGQSIRAYLTVEMKFERRPPSPSPKIGFIVTFRLVYLSLFGRVFHFLDLPKSLKTAFRDIHHNYKQYFNALALFSSTKSQITSTIVLRFHQIERLTQKESKY